MRRIIILLLVGMLCSFSYASKDSLHFERIKLDIDSNSNYSSFAMLDNYVNKYKVFFAGENHQFRYTNMKFELKMLKYLHEKAGVRYLMLEFGYSRAYLLEKYIQTGDTVSFNVLKDYSYAVYTDFYKKLYEYNKSLKSDDKIHVIGIDAERFLGLPVKLMSMQLPSGILPPDSIALSVESLRGLASYNDEYHKQANMNVTKDDDISSFYASSNFSNQNSLMPILEDYKNHKNLFQQYLGKEKFAIFDEAIKTIKTYIKWDGFNDEQMVQGYVFREQFMYSEFMKVLDADPNAKFFAQFGRCHVAKTLQEKACNWYQYLSIASRINESPDERVRGKVLSIGMFYPKSDLYEDTKEVFKNIQTIVDSAYESSVTLFKLQNDSLFSDFSSKYQFVVVNNHTPEEDQSFEDTVEKKIFPVETESKEENEEPVYYSFGMSYGVNIFDLGIRSSSLKFEDQIPSIGGSLSFQQNKGLCLNIQFDILNKQEKNNIQGKTTLDGYSASLDFGYDVLPVKFITLAPCIGLGFAKLKLQEEYNNLLSPEYGNKLSCVYENPALNATVSGLLSFRIAFFSIFFKGGYQFDMTNANWKSDNTKITSLGKTKYSSLFINGGIAFTSK